MNARVKSGDMGGPTGMAPKNANTTMKSAHTQAKPIKGMVAPPKAASGCPHARNAVSCCK